MLNKEYKDDIKNIRHFLSSRPLVKGCFCYGIGEEFTGRKLYKLVLVCDDIWKWQLNNHKECTKYINFLKSDNYNQIDYFGIKDNNSIIDYTLIDEYTFINSLINWEKINIAKIFGRPFITIKSNNRLDKAITINQKNSLLTSILLNKDNDLSFYNIMIKLYSLFDEYSCESIQLVLNNYDYLKDMYMRYGYIYYDKSNELQINYNKLEISKLPEMVKESLNSVELQKLFYQLKNKMIEELSNIKSMRILVNGILGNFNYKGRIYKTKTLRGSI